jgi:hypothetical protein
MEHFFLQMEPLFAPCARRPYIKFCTEALRTHPRRSERVSEVDSPWTPDLVRCLLCPPP